MAFKRKLTINLLLCLLMVFVNQVRAQEDDGMSDFDDISLFHNPPFQEEALPPVGTKFIVSVNILNSESLEGEMRMVGSRDGLVLDVPVQRIFLNTHDRPEYNFELYAPQTEMTYHFIYYPIDHQPIMSENFSLQRDCRPAPALTNLEQEISAGGQERLNDIVFRARSLEKDINAYSEVTNLLKQLKDEFDLLNKN